VLTIDTTKIDIEFERLYGQIEAFVSNRCGEL